MTDRRYSQRYPNYSLRGPVTLFVVVLALILTLSVLWNVVLVHDYQELKALAFETRSFHWTFIALGSALFVAIIVLSSILAAQLFAQIRWSQRLTNFTSSVGHELNSPLTSIKLFVQTMRKPDLSLEDRLAFIDKILFDVERLHRLIANILRAAEMDRSGEELLVVPQAVALGDYLQSYVGDAQALYRTSRLELQLESPENLTVQLDPMMFRQVLDNLLDNAVRYRGEGPPSVTIAAEALDHSVEIRVTDHGVGIDAHELGKIFERYYRIKENQPQRRRQGTGIGLHVVRSIVVAHGGTVGARSRGEGQGATFWIRLPLVADKPPAGKAPRASLSPSPTSSQPEAP